MMKKMAEKKKKSVKIIDGRAIAAKVRADVAAKVAAFRDSSGKTPRLDVILVGDSPASKTYVGMKERAAAEVGIKSVKHEYASADEMQLLALIEKLNADPEVSGILVQLPLPKGIDERRVLHAIAPEKDVDGLHEKNAGLLFKGEDGLKPCTPYGVMKMLEHECVKVEGKHAVVIGRSALVGKPLAVMLLNANATVTVCHSKTKDLASYTREADILVAAAGSPRMVTSDMVKRGAVVIDVGTTKVGELLCGDVDFQKVKRKASLITPVPGGVGPMTVAMLMRNTLEAAQKQAAKTKELEVCA
jgi:methylenetetrahydrofolate dehydrogenase (NADP+)/methenyltetrahydrofolate cyclohydrolase